MEPKVKDYKKVSIGNKKKMGILTQHLILKKTDFEFYITIQKEIITEM